MLLLQTQVIERSEGLSARDAEREAVRGCLDALGISEPIGHHESGAPFIVGRPELLVSISHCRQMACVAVGEAADGPFGIDVEDVTRSQLARVAPRIMTPGEVAAAVQMPDGLARAWTAKEAVYKAVLTPGADFTRDIRLAPDLASATFVPTDTRFALTYSYPTPRILLCIATHPKA